MRHIIAIPIPLTPTAIELVSGVVEPLGHDFLGEPYSSIGVIDLTIDGVALLGRVRSMDVKYGKLLAEVEVEVSGTNLRIERSALGKD